MLLVLLQAHTMYGQPEASVFGIKPWRVAVAAKDVPLMSGQLLPGGHFSVFTVSMSRVVTNVGIALGLNPCKCSAISGRKTSGTCVQNHPEGTPKDCTAALGHLNQATTDKSYCDAMRLNGDTTALIRGEPVRKMPGSVELAHSRNLAPDTAAATRVGQAARSACREWYAQHRRRVPAGKVRQYAQNAHNKAFRAEMQRQFDAQAQVSKCGDTDEVLHSWFFHAPGLLYPVTSTVCQLADQAGTGAAVNAANCTSLLDMWCSGGSLSLRCHGAGKG